MVELVPGNTILEQPRQTDAAAELDLRAKAMTLWNGHETGHEPVHCNHAAGATHAAPADSGVPPRVRECVREVAHCGQGRQIVLFLDCDGTLTPIVERPEDAVLAPDMRDTLQQTARMFPTSIVSGRDRQDVARLVQLDTLYYAGSHGFDISGPRGLRLEQEDGMACLPDLDQAQRELEAQWAATSGVRVDRKRFAIAVHYRQAPETVVPRVEQFVDRVREAHPMLRKRGGKMVFELQPDSPWNKGQAVLWLLDAFGLEHGRTLPVYLGDDETDEDAFAVLSRLGIGILVSDCVRPTLARYRLADTHEVRQFLDALRRAQLSHSAPSSSR
jgi:trehalose-phosphatase